MICHDFQPVSIVENLGFKQLLKTTAPHYKIPSRKTINKLLDSKYEVISNIICSKIECAEYYSLTTDIWTDVLNSKSFLGVTIHMVQSNKMYSCTLEVHQRYERHLSTYISEQLGIICQKCRVVNDKITAVVTDGAVNMKCAVESSFGNDRYIHCLAHQLNLVATQSIKNVPLLMDLLKKVKNIVTWFKRSVVACDELRKVQQNQHQKMLKQEIETRWNSTFLMISRFLELRDYIGPILNKHVNAPDMVTGRELRELECVKQILQPLDSATNDISGQKYVTCSIVIPMLHNLEENVHKVSVNAQNLEIATALKLSLLKEMHKRFDTIEQHSILAVATLMDPRFKKNLF